MPPLLHVQFWLQFCQLDFLNTQSIKYVIIFPLLTFTALPHCPHTQLPYANNYNFASYVPPALLVFMSYLLCVILPACL